MLTAERARTVFCYDPDTGHLTWRVNRYRVKAGHRAGSLKILLGRRYREVTIDRVAYKEHRVVFLIVTGAWPDGEIDHINGDACDNRSENLRVVTRSENSRNMAKPKSNTSGVVGVSWHKATNRFRADIGVDGRKKSLGLFRSFDDAVAARKQAEQAFAYHPNHGR